MASRFVDLTLMIHEGMTTFPVHWHPVVEITQLGRHGIENRETRKLVLGTHTGTHIDAPRHFVRGGSTIEFADLATLIGPASFVDLHHLPSRHEVSQSELEQALRGRDCTRVVLRYDWDRHLCTNAYYTDHPFLSEDACRWLVASGCKLLAMDSPMPDNPINGRGSSNDSPNHTILLAAGTLIVEYLCNLVSVTAATAELIVLPLKIKDGDGAPVRCVARLEESV